MPDSVRYQPSRVFTLHDHPVVEPCHFQSAGMEPGLYQGPKQTEVLSQLDVARIPIGRYHRAKCWIGLWMYPRFIERRIREALADTPAVILNGPRQSGKTTLARRLAGPDWTYLTLDDATLLNAARSDPVGEASWADERVSFFHYRDKDQVEVDFVIENEAGDVVGIEVKAAAQPWRPISAAWSV